jgi:hypothetical protein
VGQKIGVAGNGSIVGYLGFKYLIKIFVHFLIIAPCFVSAANVWEENRNIQKY